MSEVTGLAKSWLGGDVKGPPLYQHAIVIIGRADGTLWSNVPISHLELHLSHLEMHHPWHAGFLHWHTERMRIYGCAPVTAELKSKARDWVVKDIRRGY